MSRRIRKIAGALGIALLAMIIVMVAIAIIQGRRTPSGRPDYVALGSSFAAGAGLGSLQQGSPLLCARSVDGYPQQLARRRDLAIVDMSCGGAVTKNVIEGGQFFQGPQVRVITAQTRLVTLTVGGNDIGYVGDLSLLAARKQNTLLGWLTKSFWKGPKPMDRRGFDILEQRLSATLRLVHAQAPHATVVVATYPTLLPPEGTCAKLGLTAREVDLMRPVGDRLAAVTRTVAQREGAVVVDMHTLGAAHDACAPEPWANGWVDVVGAPFHPTLAGAQATAAAISDALDAAPRPRGSPRGL
ncbi:SGNH/GDSL hydrolase family protein [soil metagenome]